MRLICRNFFFTGNKIFLITMCACSTMEWFLPFRQLFAITSCVCVCFVFRVFISVFVLSEIIIPFYRRPNGENAALCFLDIFPSELVLYSCTIHEFLYLLYRLFVCIAITALGFLGLFLSQTQIEITRKSFCAQRKSIAKNKCIK